MTAETSTPTVAALLAERSWIEALARSLVVDVNAADDLVQDASLAALTKPPRDPAALRSWLRRVMRRLHLNRVRGEARRTAREQSTRPRSASEAPSDLVERWEIRRRIADAVLELPEPYRTTILLRFFEGHDQRAAAAILGVPEQTVHTRVTRALAKLRSSLRDLDDGPRRRARIALFWLSLADGVRQAGVRRSTRAAPGVPVAMAAMTVGTKTAIGAGALVLLLAASWLAFDHDQVVDVRGGDERTPSVLPAAVKTRAPRAQSAEVPPAAETGKSSSPVHSTQATGLVRDAAGRPVAGADVVALPDVEWWRDGLNHGTSVRSGADGRFAIALEEGIPAYRLVADAPGCAPAAVRAVRPGDDLTLTLAPGATLNGTVTSLDGKPVSGAAVRWIAAVGETALLVRSAVTTDQGAYRLNGLPEPEVEHRVGIGTDGNSFVVVTAEGFAPLTVYWSPSAANARLDLCLVRGAILEGRVLDAESEAPLADVDVSVWNVQHPAMHGTRDGLSPGRAANLLTRVRTDGEGRFHASGIPAAGAHRMTSPLTGRGPLVGLVTATAPGYAPAMDLVATVPDGARVEVLLRLWPSATIAGRVVDAFGRPLEGITVSESSPGRDRATPASGLTDLPPSTVRTGPDGRYRLEEVCVTRSAPALVQVKAQCWSVTRGFGDSVTVEVRARAGETVDAPDITLADNTPSVRLVIVDEQGQPVWGASVGLDQIANQMKSDRDGRLDFRFPRSGAPPREATLLVRARSFAAAVTPSFTPSVDDPPEVRVTLVPEHRIAGRIVQTGGENAEPRSVVVANGNIPLSALMPRPGSPLQVNDLPPPHPRLVRYAYEDVVGETFDIGGLPPGPYHVQVIGQTGTATLSDVPTDARDLVLTLPAPPVRTSRLAASIELSMVDEMTGRPIVVSLPQLTRVEPDGRRTWLNTARSESPDIVKWSDVSPGSWTVLAEADGYVFVQRTVDIVGTEPVRVAVAVPRAALVHGDVFLPSGLDVQDLRVTFVRPGTAPEDRRGTVARVGESRTFDARGLDAGRWRADVARTGSDPPYLVADGVPEVDVPKAGGDLRLDLRLVEGGLVTVTLPAELPQATASGTGRVWLRDTSGREVFVRRVDPSRTTYDLPARAGSYDVLLELPGRETVSRRVSVQVGQRASTLF